VQTSKLIVLPSLILASALLVFPKVLLTVFMIEHPGKNIGVGLVASDILVILLQDFAVAILFFGAATWILRNPTPTRIFGCFTSYSLLLLVLMVDARCREIWHTPLDAQKLALFFEGISEMFRSNEMFLRKGSGLGITFRRWLFYVGVVTVVLWLPIVTSLRSTRQRASSTDRQPGRWIAPGAVILSLALLGVSVSMPKFMLGLEENIVVRHGVNAFRPKISKERLEKLAAEFELPLIPLSRSAPPRVPVLALRERPFENVVIFILESVRWRGLNLLGNGPTPTPHLRTYAEEGFLSKAYATIPHSSKSQFSIISGRYPLIDASNEEGIGSPRYPSPFWELHDARGMELYLFSAGTVEVEHIGATFARLGFRTQFEPEDMTLPDGVTRDAVSFGVDDAILLETPVEVLNSSPRPFAAVFVTNSSHHPYWYPGKPEDERSSIGTYWRSVSHTDAVVGRIVQRLIAAGLDDDTVFVFVGDHGQSFGEHGSFVHSNSMFEEEITVPLVFWASDGSLTGPVPERTSLVDIAPTLMDLVGLGNSAIRVQGRSLMRESSSYAIYSASHFEAVCQSLVQGKEKYVYFPSGDRLLHFDLESDPLEERGELVTDEAIKNRITDRLLGFVAYQEKMFEMENGD
jgi:hypothetical protein